jgi:hypothetical protein
MRFSCVEFFISFSVFFWMVYSIEIVLFVRYGLTQGYRQNQCVNSLKFEYMILYVLCINPMSLVN